MKYLIYKNIYILRIGFTLSSHFHPYITRQNLMPSYEKKKHYYMVGHLYLKQKLNKEI